MNSSKSRDGCKNPATSFRCANVYYIWHWIIAITETSRKIVGKLRAIRPWAWPSKVSIKTIALTESEFQRRLRNIFDFNHLFFQALFKIRINNKVNPLSANIPKWSNTPKQFVRKLPTNCLSLFDHFVGLALKEFSYKSHLYFIFSNIYLVH